jgi:hypothetical protein
MAGFIPDKAQLEKARAKNSFILVVNGNYNNKVYDAWENYMFKKGITLSNVSGALQDPKRDSFKAITYWVKYKAPNIDLIMAYAKKYPDLMQIFI